MAGISHERSRFLREVASTEGKRAAARLASAGSLDSRQELGLGVRGVFGVACHRLLCLLILPIWGFLPATAHNLAPVQIELTYTPSAQDLPHISLPAPGPKAKCAADTENACDRDGRAARRRRVSSATDDPFDSGSRDASATNTDSARRSGDASQRSNPNCPTSFSGQRSRRYKGRDCRLRPAFRLRRCNAALQRTSSAPDVPTVAKNSEALSVVSAAAVTPQLKKPMIPVSTAVAQRTAHARTRPARRPKWGGDERRSQFAQRNRALRYACPTGAGGKRPGRQPRRPGRDFARRQAAGFAEWEWRQRKREHRCRHGERRRDRHAAPAKHGRSRVPDKGHVHRCLAAGRTRCANRSPHCSTGHGSGLSAARTTAVDRS